MIIWFKLCMSFMLVFALSMLADKMFGISLQKMKETEYEDLPLFDKVNWIIVTATFIGTILTGAVSIFIGIWG